MPFMYVEYCFHTVTGDVQYCYVHKAERPAPRKDRFDESRMVEPFVDYVKAHTGPKVRGYVLTYAWGEAKQTQSVYFPVERLNFMTETEPDDDTGPEALRVELIEY